MRFQFPWVVVRHLALSAAQRSQTVSVCFIADLFTLVLWQLCASSRQWRTRAPCAPGQVDSIGCVIDAADGTFVFCRGYLFQLDRHASHVLELALYHVNDSAAFPHIQDKMHKELRLLPGFLLGQRIQSSSHPNVFGDVIVWEDLKQALAAARELPNLPTGVAFEASIVKMETFGHAYAAHGQRLLPALAAPGSLMQVKVFADMDDGVYDSLRAAFVAKLDDVLPGEKHCLVLVDLLETPGVRVDFGVWPSLSLADRTLKLLQATSEARTLSKQIKSVYFADDMHRLGLTERAGM